MRRFDFSLEGLRRLRAHRERAARRGLAAVMAEASRLQQRLDQVEANLETCGHEESGPTRALSQALAGGLRHNRAAISEQLQQAEQVLEAARETYRSRRRDLLVLTRLEEQQREAWQREVLAAEQAETEEMSRLLVAQRALQEDRR